MENAGHVGPVVGLLFKRSPVQFHVRWQAIAEAPGNRLDTFTTNHHHHHLTCTQCHRVVEVDVCLPEDQLNAVGRTTNFDIEGHSLTLFGRCERCRVGDRARASLAPTFNVDASDEEIQG